MMCSYFKRSFSRGKNSSTQEKAHGWKASIFISRDSTNIYCVLSPDSWGLVYRGGTTSSESHSQVRGRTPGCFLPSYRGYILPIPLRWHTEWLEQESLSRLCRDVAPSRIETMPDLAILCCTFLSMHPFLLEETHSLDHGWNSLAVTYLTYSFHGPLLFCHTCPVLGLYCSQ